MLTKHARFFDYTEDFCHSDLIIFGAPFDGTTSNRPGTRYAPSLMRLDSINLETFSPYLGMDLSKIKVADIGDLILPFGNAEKVLRIIEKQTTKILNLNKIPVMIGGEHLITLGALRAAVKKYSDLHLLHLDAHTDLREEYLGEKLSHATVIRHCFDYLGKGRIHSYGIRSGLKEEFIFAEKNLDFHPFDLSEMKNIKKEVQDKPVYITIDLDVLDPAYFPGTGTPEPGGISFNDLLTNISFFSDLNIVAFDLVELCPPHDSSGISLAAANKILREMLLITAKTKEND